MAKDKAFEIKYKEEGLRRAKIRKEKRKEKGHKKRRCEHCNKLFSHTIDPRPNPYYEEMDNVCIMERICSSCYDELLMCI